MAGVVEEKLKPKLAKFDEMLVRFVCALAHLAKLCALVRPVGCEHVASQARHTIVCHTVPVQAACAGGFLTGTKPMYCDILAYTFVSVFAAGFFDGKIPGPRAALRTYGGTRGSHKQHRRVLHPRRCAPHPICTLPGHLRVPRAHRGPAGGGRLLRAAD